jgi:hypothetical protein
VVSFPPLTANRIDPLFRYSDGSFHAAHFWQQADAEKATARWKRLREESVPERRLCVVCGKRIENPDEYFITGFLSDAPPASEFNYMRAHRSHLSSWPDLDRAIIAIEALKVTGEWDERDLDGVLDPLLRAGASRVN